MSDRESGECIRVLMYGHRGWIGGKIVDLVERLHPSWKLILGVSRVDSKDLQDELDSVKPEAIICCIGRTHGENIPTIDYLEQPGKLRENLRDNLFGPVSLGLQVRHFFHSSHSESSEPKRLSRQGKFPSSSSPQGASTAMIPNIRSEESAFPSLILRISSDHLTLQSEDLRILC